MEGVYIRWTVENLITVGLMAGILYAIFAVGAQLFLKVGVGKSGAGATLRVVA